MIEQMMGPAITFGLALVAFMVLLYIVKVFARMYTRASKELSFVRTGREVRQLKAFLAIIGRKHAETLFLQSCFAGPAQESVIFNQQNTDSVHLCLVNRKRKSKCEC